MISTPLRIFGPTARHSFPAPWAVTTAVTPASSKLSLSSCVAGVTGGHASQTMTLAASPGGGSGSTVLRPEGRVVSRSSSGPLGVMTDREDDEQRAR